MENLYETKLNVYELVQDNFEPSYRLFTNEEELEKIESMRLENLVLNVFTPKKSVNEDTVKKDIIAPQIIKNNMAKDDFKDDLKKDINELWKDYQAGNIYFAEMKEFFDGAAEESRAYDSIVKNLEYNANNSQIRTYKIPEAKEIIDSAKAIQGVRGGKPKQKFLDSVNERLVEIYENYSDLMDNL